jgi:hypothetical protein
MQATGSTSRLGRISYAAIAWLLGLPLPIILIALIWGGCTKF